MVDCEYYQIYHQNFKNRTIGRQREAPTKATIPYCNHDKSPVTLKFAQSVIGGGNLLKCGGDQKNCQISPEELDEDD